MTRLKNVHPNMGGVFGSYDRPEYLPSWIKYIKNASQEETIRNYNNISVFCALLYRRDIVYWTGVGGLWLLLCSADYSAVHEYAEDGVNCILSPVSDIDAQTENISRLFEDAELKMKLASIATETVKSFFGDIAVDSFMNLIK
jgi:hypothetical protein